MNYLEKDTISLICTYVNRILSVRTASGVGFLEYYKPFSYIIITTKGVLHAEFPARNGKVVDIYNYNNISNIFDPLAYCPKDYQPPRLKHITS